MIIKDFSLPWPVITSGTDMLLTQLNLQKNGGWIQKIGIL